MELVKTVILSGWPALVQIMTAYIFQNFCFCTFPTNIYYLIINFNYLSSDHIFLYNTDLIINDSIGSFLSVGNAWVNMMHDETSWQSIFIASWTPFYLVS
jgi:hypothetical protein